jgi:hypothetical protein
MVISLSWKGQFAPLSISWCVRRPFIGPADVPNATGYQRRGPNHAGVGHPQGIFARVQRVKGGCDAGHELVNAFACSARAVTGKVVGPGVKLSLVNVCPGTAFPLAKVHFLQFRVFFDCQIGLRANEYVRE